MRRELEDLEDSGAGFDVSEHVGDEIGVEASEIEAAQTVVVRERARGPFMPKDAGGEYERPEVMLSSRRTSDS